MMRIQRRAGVLAVAVAVGLVPTVSGCGALKLEQLPAPKGVSGPVYHLTAQFADVSNLVQGAKVKLQGVVVGDVTSISTRDFHAEVRMEISTKFRLAEGSTFQIRFNTPLGEDFIAASEPSKGGPPLADGATIPVSQTAEAPGIEDTFAALSLLLNGGGLDKLHIIANELDQALKGRGATIRDTIVQLHTIITNFDAHKGDFDRALDSLARMSVALNKGTDLVDQALTEFPQVFTLLANDTKQVSVLLGKVAKLGDTVKGLLDRSQAAMLADFDALRPTLDALRAEEGNLVPTFNALIEFGKLFDRATPGDYVNASITVRFLLNAPGQKPVPGGTIYSGAEPSSSSDMLASLISGGQR